jgi:hypothetical protein
LLSEPALPASELAARPIPSALDGLLGAALAKDPSARPASMQAFRSAIETLAA